MTYPRSRVLDLNAPGALEALRRENPVHYRKLQQILNGLTDRPQEDIPNWIQTNFAASDVVYSLHLLTSEPPKERHLKLNLDDTRYEAVVTLRRSGGTICPMK